MRKVPAVLVAVVGATIVTAVFDLDVSTVGALPQGLPRPDFPWTDVHDALPLLVAAVGHHARLADRHDRHVDQSSRASVATRSIRTRR